MKVLITADFFSDFELYETTDPAALKEAARRAMLYGEPIADPVHVLTGSIDNMTTEEATAAADMIIYTRDF